MERIDTLVKRKATGTPHALADRLNISKASLHRIVDVMQELGAPIEYNISCRSYVYSREVEFYCGFYCEELSQHELKKMSGGYDNLSVLTKINIEDMASRKK